MMDDVIKFPKEKKPRPVMISEAVAKAIEEGTAQGLRDVVEKGLTPHPIVDAIFRGE